MRHFSSNNLRDEKKGPIKFLFAFFSWCVFSQGLSLFLVPLRPVCSDCQKVAPFLHFFPAAHWQELCATFSKHLDLCASPERNDSETSWPVRLDRYHLDVVQFNPRFLSACLPVLIYILLPLVRSGQAWPTTATDRWHENSKDPNSPEKLIRILRIAGFPDSPELLWNTDNFCLTFSRMALSCLIPSVRKYLPAFARFRET